MWWINLIFSFGICFCVTCGWVEASSWGSGGKLRKGEDWWLTIVETTLREEELPLLMEEMLHVYAV